MDAREFIKKLNAETGFLGEVRFDEMMALHTTFRLGGPADVWVRPDAAVFPEYAAALFAAAAAESIPVFVLGGGANIVVSDRGIRGVTLDCSAWEGVTECEGGLLVRAGTSVDAAAGTAAARSLSGLEFLSGMPGSVGGAVWMNARCYEREAADVLTETEILDENLRRATISREAGGFDYKKSPFQGRRVLILQARFALEKGDAAAIRAEMERNRADREAKGHYRYPCAGSVFKNNRSFGAPTGRIIDSLGLRGTRLGGAQVAPWHGNIIINTGDATASAVRALVGVIRERAAKELSINLEPEIIFAGEW